MKVWNALEKLIRLVMQGILRLFHKEWDDGRWESFFQFVRFCFVGVSNTVLSYVINVAVLLMLQNLSLSWDYIAANVVAFVLSVLWSFYWNQKFVFRLQEGETRHLGKALLKTYISYAFTGIVLNNLLSWLWITKCGISKFVAPVINLLVSVPINFLLNKLWAFKKA